MASTPDICPRWNSAVAIRSAGEGGHGDCWSFGSREAERGDPVTAGRFRHVLVGWDASADAAEALSAAASIAGDERDSERAAARRWVEEQFERARQVVASANGARMSLEIVESPQVARVVCDYAAEHGFDLLVLG